MAKKNTLTPGVLVANLRENMNGKGTLKAQFRNLFLSKLTEDELNGIKDGIEKEIASRKQAVVDEKIKFLQDLGYKVSK